MNNGATTGEPDTSPEEVPADMAKPSEDKLASSSSPPSPPKSDESVETSMPSPDTRDATPGLDHTFNQQSQPLEQGSAVLGVDLSIDGKAATSTEARTSDVATPVETPSEATAPSGSLPFDEKSPIATEVSGEATPPYVGEPSEQCSEAAFEETSPSTPSISNENNHKITKPPSPPRISYASVLKSPVQETNETHSHRRALSHEVHDVHQRTQKQGTSTSFTPQKTCSSQSAELQEDQAKTPQSKGSSSMPLSSDASPSDLAPPSPPSGAPPQVTPSLASPQCPTFSVPRSMEPQRKFISGQLPNNLDDPSVDLRHLLVAPWCTRDPEFESPRDISYDEAHSHNWDMEEQLMRTRWHPTRYLRSQTEGCKDEEVPIRNTAARLVDLMPCKEFEKIGLSVPMPHAKHRLQEWSWRSFSGFGTGGRGGGWGDSASSWEASSPSSSFACENAQSTDDSDTVKTKSRKEEKRLRRARKRALKQSTQDKSSPSSEDFSNTDKKKQGRKKKHGRKKIGKQETFRREALAREEGEEETPSSSISIPTRGQEQEDVEEGIGASGTTSPKKRRSPRDKDAVGVRIPSGRGTAKKR
ncbi:hypothetical protein CPB97_005252 [Podila verticillata]|nr:hypothetical protein CPB97_005252 [Podila verticillata]